MNGDRFRPDALEALFAPLEELARGLWLPAITAVASWLPARLAGVAALREALFEGRLPADRLAGWLPSHVADPMAASLRELDLPRYCRAQDEVTEQVVRSLLWHLNRIPDHRDRHGDTEAEAARRAATEFAADWDATTSDFDEVLRVFEELGDLAQFARWQAVRGLLRSGQWQELVRIRDLLGGLDELRRLIRSLGRSRAVEEWGASVVEVQERRERVRELVSRQQWLRLPHVPCETHGLKRSADIARMLPAESALLGHPRLRLLWHARRTERNLLCYDDEDSSVETVLAEADTWRPRLVPAPGQRLEAGPIIVCVDTSGSMQGAPENVAKAVVLEAMRTARRQGRACHVVAFGGPGELLEHTLDLDADGLERLLGFIGQSFGGGTDIAEAIERAVRCLAEHGWCRADLVIASDGEFGVTREVAELLRRVRAEQGLRVQGILIGDRETIGLLEVCDDIFWLRDWRRYGSQAEVPASPVHSRSLTAMYFPNALRG